MAADTDLALGAILIAAALLEATLTVYTELVTRALLMDLALRIGLASIKEAALSGRTITIVGALRGR